MFNGTDTPPFENKLYLSSPTMHGDELQYIQEAYDTNWMSTVGKNIDESECLISEIVGRKYAVALASGTASLHLAIKLAGITKGTKVFCSDLTFIASTNPIIYEGAEPIFIDSDYRSWNMSPEALEKAFEKYPEVKHVVTVNLFGTPCDYDRIREICDRHNAVIIEDAAESLGALYNGQQAGTFGDISAVSFNGNKIITGTSGGMLLTDDESLAQKARKWSTQSRDCAPWYQHTELGYNYRMSNIVAGVIRGQIPYIGDHIAEKKRIYQRYKEGFRDLPVQMNPIPDNTEPNFWLSCMTVDPEAMCDQKLGDTEYTYTKEGGKTCPMEILEAIKSINAEGRPLWKPMHLQPLFGHYDYISSGRDTDLDLFSRGLCLPSDNKMTEEQQDAIIEVVCRCFD